MARSNWSKPTWPVALLWIVSLGAAAPLGRAQAVEATKAPATYGPWHSSRIGGGGYLQHLVFCPSDPRRLYLAIDVGGLYRSDDGGKTWRMLHGSLPARAGNYSVAALSVHPANADELVIATGSRWDRPEGIYITDDGGATWRQTLEGAWFMADGPHRADGHVLVRSPDDPRLLIAGAIRTGVFRSTDGGRTWTNVGLHERYPTAIVFDRMDPSHVWLCAFERGPFSAHGGGVPALGGGLFESHDAGQTWEQIATRAPREFVQDPVDPTRLYGIFHTENDYGVRVSQAGGRTWTDCAEGLPSLTNPRDSRDPGLFRAIATGPDFVLLGASNGAIYRRDHGQDRWQLVERQRVEVGDWFGPKVETLERRFGAAMGYLVVNPADPNHFCFTDWYALYQSFDAGRTWTLTIDGVEATVIHVLRGSPGDPNLVHLGMGDNGYFRSTDGGATFQVVAEQISNNVKDIAVSPANPARVYAVGPSTWGWHANRVFISDDAGQTWRKAGVDGLPDMTKQRCNTVVADPHDADTVWLAVSGALASGGGVYRSTDAGRSWHAVNRGLPEGQGLFRSEIWVVGRELAIGPDGSALIASHHTGRVFRLDGPDSTWQACPSPQGRRQGGQFNEVMAGAEPGLFYLAARGAGLYRTTDHGRSWSRIGDQSAHRIAIDPRHPQRIAVATDDGVILSLDGGEHWRMLSKELPYRVARLPLCFVGDRLVVGTAGSGVFWMSLDQVTFDEE